jgi:hypothetical protein
MVAGLGAVWILDGLQITIASSVTGVLASPNTLGMTSTEIGLTASVSWSARSSARRSSAGRRTSWEVGNQPMQPAAGCCLRRRLRVRTSLRGGLRL